MGRKSLATERREAILDAFERCIVKYGLEGSSLEQIADEAGMKRSIIRHYIGNRDELVDQLVERAVANYQAQILDSFAHVTGPALVEKVLEVLFAVQATYNAQDKLVVDVLMTAKERYPRAKQLLAAMFNDLIATFAADLAAVYPTAEPAACQRVSYAIFCLAMSHESFLWLGVAPTYHSAARQTAEQLLATLGRSQARAVG
jgi:AcrR family transcriptional regulator